MIKFQSRLLLFLAILQFATPALPALGLGQSVGSNVLENGVLPEVPPGIFFAIWGVIFTGFFLTSLRFAVAPGHESVRLTLPLSICALGNIVWMLNAQFYGSVVASAVILWPTVLASWLAAYRLDRMGGFNGTLTRLLACAATGLLAGWLTVATGISLPAVARLYAGWGPTDEVWLALWIALVPTASMALAFPAFISRSLWFYVALLWGLVGIIITNWAVMELHGLALATASATSLLLALRIGRRAAGSGRRMNFQH